MLEGLYPLDGLLSPLKSWRRWLGMGGVVWVSLLTLLSYDLDGYGLIKFVLWGH